MYVFLPHQYSYIRSNNIFLLLRDRSIQVTYFYFGIHYIFIYIIRINYYSFMQKYNYLYLFAMIRQVCRDIVPAYFVVCRLLDTGTLPVNGCYADLWYSAWFERCRSLVIVHFLFSRRNNAYISKKMWVELGISIYKLSQRTLKSRSAFFGNMINRF